VRKLLGWPELVPAVLLLMSFFVGARLSPYFLDLHGLLDRSTIFAETGLMVIGMTFVIICGQIDLSIAANLALVACVTGKLAEHQSLPFAVTCGVLLGAILGAVNGAMVAYAKLPSFLVTLGTLALYRGIAQALVGSASVPLPRKFSGIDTLFLPYPIPLTLTFVLLVALGLGFVLHRSVLGRWVYATGANEQASHYSSVPTARVKLGVFTLAGLIAGIGGAMMDSRLGVARFDHAKGFELDVITATVLGGASIYGGKGSMLGAMLAFFLIFSVKSGMSAADYKPEVQLTVVGALLILALALQQIRPK
jgi:rhamnose transport system permease protein